MKEHVKPMWSSAENEQVCESQTAQAVSCILRVQFSGFEGFRVCVSLSAFYNADRFQSGLF